MRSAIAFSMSGLAAATAALLSLSLELLLGCVDERLGVVLRLDQLALLLVFGRVRLGVLDHALDLAVRKAAGGLDADRLLLAGRLVLAPRRARCRWRRCRTSPRSAERRAAPAGMPTRSNCPSSLLSAAISRSPWLTRMVTAFWPSSAVEKVWLFLVGIVVLRSISRVNTPPSVSMPSDSGVTSSNRTSLTSPLQHAALDGGADGDDLVRVDALVRLLAEQLLHDLLHLRHAGHAADEHDLVDVGRLEAGVLERLLARTLGALR